MCNLLKNATASSSPAQKAVDCVQTSVDTNTSFFPRAVPSIRHWAKLWRPKVYPRQSLFSGEEASDWRITTAPPGHNFVGNLVKFNAATVTMTTVGVSSSIRIVVTLKSPIRVVVVIIPKRFDL